MTARITQQGTYQLFRDTDGNQILKLDGTRVQLIQGPGTEVMARQAGDFQPEELLSDGEFKFVSFDEEDGEDDRLLLQRTDDFRVVLFVEGLPQGPDDEVLCRFSEEIVGLDEVETYVNSLKAAAVDGQQRLATSDIATAAEHHLQSMDFPAEKAMLIDYAHRRQAADEIIEFLDRMEDRNYNSLRDVIIALDDVQRADRLALEEQSTDELIALIQAMEPAELHDLREYERRHGRRDEVIEAIDRQLQM